MFLSCSGEQSPEQEAAANHDGAEQLAHGYQVVNHTYLGIRFSEEFNNEPENSITDKKQSE